MMIELTKSEQTHEDDNWIYGKTFTRLSENHPWVEFTGGWIKTKQPVWFSKSTQNILSEHFNITATSRRALDLESFFEGDINGWYYLAAATDGTDEVVKWILGPIAAYMNETELSFTDMRRKLPADYLKSFLEYLRTSKFDKGFSKDIFNEFLLHGISFNEDNRRLTGYEVLDKIISNPKYKAVDSSELDSIIDIVISNNAAMAESVKENPKVIQRFVGLVMKEAKGKATGEVVLNKLKEKLL